MLKSPQDLTKGLESLIDLFDSFGLFSDPSEEEVKESSKNRLEKYRKNLVEILETKGLIEIIQMKDALLSLEIDKKSKINKFEITKRINLIQELIKHYILLGEIKKHDVLESNLIQTIKDYAKNGRKKDKSEMVESYLYVYFHYAIRQDIKYINPTDKKVSEVREIIINSEPVNGEVIVEGYTFTELHLDQLIDVTPGTMRSWVKHALDNLVNPKKKKLK